MFLLATLECWFIQCSHQGITHLFVFALTHIHFYYRGCEEAPSFILLAFSQSKMNYSVLCSATFWHLRFIAHVGFWARNAVRYPRSAWRWIQISLFAFIAAPILIPQCCKPWLMSSPNMLANSGPLQLHSSLAPDIPLHFCNTSNIWGLFLSSFVAKDSSKRSLPLSASTPEPVKLDKSNCRCLCSSHVLLLSSLQVDMPSSPSAACLYLG